MQTPLPRHVGILSAFLDKFHIFDIVLDVSEVERDPSAPPVIAIVAPGIAKQSPAWKVLAGVCNQVKWPLITGPIGPAPASAPPTTPAAPSLPSGGTP
jgi:hypothetical protein